MKTIKYPSAPLKVELDVTTSCNLRCIHCSINGGKRLPNELSTKEIISVLNQLSELNVFYVNVVGGEPLTRPDLFSFLNHAKNIGLPFNLTTNGLLLNKERVHIINKLEPKNVRVSLDGHTPKINDYFRGMKGAFEKTVSGIKLLTTTSLPISIYSVATSFNIDCIPNILKLAENLGVGTYAVMGFCPTGRGTRDLIPQYQKWKNLVLFLTEKKKELKSTMNIELVITCPWELILPLYQSKKLSLVKKIWKYESIPFYFKNTGCEAGLVSCSIGADGSVYPCDLLSNNSNFIAGNIREKSFKEIWDDSEIMKLFRNLEMSDMKGDCNECKIKSMCGGGCRAAAYGLFGDIFAPDIRCGQQKRFKNYAKNFT